MNALPGRYIMILENHLNKLWHHFEMILVASCCQSDSFLRQKSVLSSILGGGSVSSVLDGRILNSCSDGCSASETIRCPAGFDGSIHCERTVTSIICIS